MATKLHLEDLSIGQIFKSPWADIDVGEIKGFATEFDPQPLHLDEENAADDPFFSGVVASGWHTAALTMRLLVQGGLPLANGIIGLGTEVTWVKPVRPGDRLMTISEIVDITPSHTLPDRGVAIVRTETQNQYGEPVQIMTSKLLVFRRLT